MMTNQPPRKRGRPSNAERAAREAAAATQPAAEPEDTFLNDVLARPIGPRRTLLQVDDETIRIISELAKLAATQKEIAAVLGVGESTLRSFLYDNEIAYQAWEDGLQHAKVSLRRKQLGLADKNAPMAIFLGKNMLGQKDEQQTNLTVNRPAQEMSEAELLTIAQQGARKAAKQTTESVH